MPRRIFLFGVILLFVAGAYAVMSAWMTYAHIAKLEDAGQSAMQSEQVRSTLNAFVVAVLDMESSTRGFRMSADPAMAVTFDTGRRQVPRLLDDLRDLLRNNPTQLARVQQLVPLVAERIAVSERVLARAQSGGGAGAPENLDTNATASILRVVDEIDVDGRRELADRRMTWGRDLDSARETELAFVVAAVLLFGLSAWVLMKLRRYVPLRMSNLPGPMLTEDALTDPAIAISAFSAPDHGVGKLLYDALARTQLVEEAFEPKSRERAAIDPLRQALQDAYSSYQRVADEIKLAVAERAALPVVLQRLVDNYRQRELFALQESIDFSLGAADVVHSQLLCEAAEWALEVLAHRAIGDDVNISLSGNLDALVLRVLSPHRGPTALTPGEEQSAAAIAAALLGAGGTWDWRCDEEGTCLTATLRRTHVDAEPSEAAPGVTRA